MWFAVMPLVFVEAWRTSTRGWDDFVVGPEVHD